MTTTTTEVLPKTRIHGTDTWFLNIDGSYFQNTSLEVIVKMITSNLKCEQTTNSVKVFLCEHVHERLTVSHESTKSLHLKICMFLYLL